MLLLEQFHTLTLYPQNAAKLKELVLQLVVQGKLTEKWRAQNLDIEPASQLLKRISEEKARLIKEKKIKKEEPLPAISEVEIPYELPEGWIWCRLGDLGYCQTGATPPTNNSAYFGSYIPFIGPANISPLGINYNGNGLSEEGLVKGRLIPKNSILMVCIGGSIGKLNMTDRDVSCNQQINTITPLIASSRLIKSFLGSPYFQKKVIESASGSATPIINKGKWESILVPLPPFAEQQAIVARVEELMAKIEELEKQTVERIALKKKVGDALFQQLTTSTNEEMEQSWLFLKEHFQTIFDEEGNVKKLRESILQLAVQGKLTQAWRKQHLDAEPASELIKRIREEKARLIKEKKIKKEVPLPPISKEEIPYELPEGWTWCRIGDVILDIEAGTSPNCEPQEATIDEWGVIKISAVSWGKFLEKENKKLPSSITPFTDKEIKPGDFIMSRANTADLIARSVVVDDGVRSKLLLNDKTLRVKFNSEILKRYCNIFNNGETARGYYKSVATGTSDSMKNISRENIKYLPIPLPSEKEQHVIISKFYELMNLCDALEKQISQSKQEAERLMQAALYEALQVKEEVEL